MLTSGPPSPATTQPDLPASRADPAPAIDPPAGLAARSRGRAGAGQAAPPPPGPARRTAPTARSALGRASVADYLARRCPRYRLACPAALAASGGGAEDRGEGKGQRRGLSPEWFPGCRADSLTAPAPESPAVAPSAPDRRR